MSETGLAFKSSQGGLEGYIGVWTFYEVIFSFFKNYSIIKICWESSSIMICPHDMCGWWSRGEGSRRALRHLAAEFLDVQIQNGEHCPVSILILFLSAVWTENCILVALSIQLLKHLALGYDFTNSTEMWQGSSKRTNSMQPNFLSQHSLSNLDDMLKLGLPHCSSFNAMMWSLSCGM